MVAHIYNSNTMKWTNNILVETQNTEKRGKYKYLGNLQNLI
jgi:hypothetical protein